MRSEALEYLGCPECKSELETGRVRTWKGDIRSGNLICRRCGLNFPIVVGRPVLMTSNSIDHWKAPIDEVLGIDTPALPPLSIPRHVSFGIDEALKMAETEKARQSIQTQTKMRSIQEIPGAVIGKMKYRDSGEWFRHGKRSERHLKFPWKNGDERDAFNIFMKKDGHFIIKVTELPFNGDLISVSEFVKFAEKTDLYAGYEKFQADAEKCGFRIEESKRFTGTSGRLVRLITFSK